MIEYDLFQYERECKPLDGHEIERYGLPNTCSGGYISKKIVDEALEVVRLNPELHIISWFKDCTAVNCYHPEAAYYLLGRGNADPNIKIKFEYSLDLSEEDAQKLQDEIDEIMKDFDLETEVKKMAAKL